MGYEQHKTMLGCLARTSGRRNVRFVQAWVVLTGSRPAVWPQVGPVLVEARTTGTGALAASVAAVARCEPRQARGRCGWLETDGLIGLFATRRAELEGLVALEFVGISIRTPCSSGRASARQVPSPHQGPDKGHSTPPAGAERARRR